MHALIDAETKECNKCGEVKSLTSFYPNKSCKDGFTGTCRSCSYGRLKVWYESARRRRQVQANERGRARKQVAIDLLGGKCMDCNGVFDNVVYDFHHVDGTKEGNPSDMLRSNPLKGLEEVKKCVLLCANCHRLRHKAK